LSTGIVPILYRAPAFGAFDAFSDFVESITSCSSKSCQECGSNPCRGATYSGAESLSPLVNAKVLGAAKFGGSKRLRFAGWDSDLRSEARKGAGVSVWRFGVPVILWGEMSRKILLHRADAGSKSVAFSPDSCRDAYSSE